MTIRLLALANTPAINIPSPPSPAQRAYPAMTAGQTLDVPGDLTGDAAVLLGNYVGGSAAFLLIGTSGPTPSRPTASLRPGALHVDTGLSIVVVWDGTNWRSPLTGSVQ
jgi:hypothetical protein